MMVEENLKIRSINSVCFSFSCIEHHPAKGTLRRTNEISASKTQSFRKMRLEAEISFFFDIY